MYLWRHLWWARVYFNVKKSFIQHDLKNNQLRKENEKLRKENENEKVETRNEKVEMTNENKNFKKWHS